MIQSELRKLLGKSRISNRPQVVEILLKNGKELLGTVDKLKKIGFTLAMGNGVLRWIDYVEVSALRLLKRACWRRIGRHPSIHRRKGG